MRRVLVCALAVSFAACAYDWSEFVSDDGGAGADAGTPATNDGSTPTPGEDASALEDANVTPMDVNVPPVDTGVDAPPACTASAACIGTATSCGAACGTTSAQCVAACSNNGCRNQCRATETTCRTGCASQCVTCTQAAGCPSAGPCNAAANAG